MNRIIPFTGECLVRVLPPEGTERGIVLPEVYHEHRSTPENPINRKPGATGIVCEVGPWLKSSQGIAFVPEVKIGDTVIVSEYAPCRKVRSHGDGDMRIFKLKDILATLTPAQRGHSLAPS